MALAGPAGWWLGGRGRNWWIGAATFNLAGTITYPIIARRPDILLAIYPSRDFAVIDPVWFVPFAVCFLGIAARQVDRRLTRGGVAALAGFLVLLGGTSAIWVASGAQVDLRNNVDDEGVVRQTSYYTCGAAAAATLCRRLGVPMTEAEMARRTQVVPWVGTTMVKVYWALEDVLGDRVDSVRLLHCPVLAPGAVPTPCVADLRLAFGLNHLVLVREVRADAVVIEDPMTGMARIPLAEARRMWQGAVIAVDRRDPMLPIDSSLRRLAGQPLAPRSPAQSTPARARTESGLSGNASPPHTAPVSR